MAVLIQILKSKRVEHQTRGRGLPVRSEDIGQISAEWGNPIPGARKSLYGDTL